MTALIATTGVVWCVWLALRFLVRAASPDRHFRRRTDKVEL